MAASPAIAAQATLSWDPPAGYADGTPITGAIGYKVHIGTASGAYTQSIDVASATTYVASNLSDGTSYYFAVSAYDSTGTESPVSNEMSKSIPAPPPTPPASTTPTTGNVCILGSPYRCYTTLLEALSIAQSGETIMAQALTFSENVSLTANAGIYIKGGYDSTFSSQVGVTTINGVLSISDGSLEMDGLAIL